MKAIALALLAAAFALPAAAQQQLKPGLWEIQQKMGGNPELEQQMAQAKAAMAAMPPEQRKQMEAMMARQGVQMGANNSIRICMTKEMVEKNEIPSQQGDCKVTNQARSGNTMKASFACTNPASSGNTEVTIASPEAYTMKTNVTTSARGKPEQMTLEGSGKFVGADCGSVKPVQAPKK